MKIDNLSMTLLFDYFGELLTEKQKAYFDLYYNQDFSLAEIAENEGISRQGVHDTLNRTEKLLRQFEEKTGIVARAMARQAAVGELQKAIGQVPDEALRRKLLTLCDTLEE